MIGLGEGRVVHYVEQSGFHRAAIVVFVDEEHKTANLWAPPVTRRFYSDGQEQVERLGAEEFVCVRFSKDCKRGTWHWCERVES